MTDTPATDGFTIFWSPMERELRIHFPSESGAEKFLDQCFVWLRDAGKLSVADVLSLLNGKIQADHNKKSGWTSLNTTTISQQGDSGIFILRFPKVTNLD